MGVLGLYVDTGVLGRSTPAAEGVLGRSTEEEEEGVFGLESEAGDLGRFLLAMMLAPLLLLLPEAPGRRLDTLEARELHTDRALSRTELHDRFCGSAELDLFRGPRLHSVPSSWSRHRGKSSAPSAEPSRTRRSPRSTGTRA